MQTRNLERPRTLWRCLLLGIACVAFTACTKFERDYVRDAFNDCISYARLIEDDMREKKTDTVTIIKQCDDYAQTFRTDNE